MRQIFFILSFFVSVASVAQTTHMRSDIAGKQKALGWFDATDYGAIGDNSTDNTTAFTNCIAAVITAGGGTMYIPRGVYVGKIIIPVVTGTDWVAIKIVGESQPAPIFGTVGTFTLLNNNTIIRSASTSGAAVISATENTGLGNFQGFSSINVTIEDLEVRTYNQPQINGIDLFYAQQAQLRNLVINNGKYSPESSFPTAGKKGLVPPQNANGALTYMENVSVSGYYTGIEVNEHTRGYNLNVTACVEGLRYPYASHGSHIFGVNVQRCTYPIVVKGIHQFYISGLNIEHADLATQTDANNVWQVTAYDIKDTANLGIAEVKWTSFTGNASSADVAITKSGGSGVVESRVGSGGGSGTWTEASGEIYRASNVGINTTDPIAPLDLRGAPITDGSSKSTLVTLDNTTAYGSTPSAGIYGGGRYNATSSLSGFGAINFRKENTTLDNIDGTITFYTKKDSDGSMNEKFRISSLGDLLQNASSYHSWGSTMGSTGYGFRDNAGTMQYKNSGGSWADIGSGGSSGLTISSTQVAVGSGTNTAAGSSALTFTNTSNTPILKVLGGSVGSVYQMENSDTYQSQIGKLGNAYGTYKAAANHDFLLYNGTHAGNITILNDYTSGNIVFASGGVSAAQMIIKPSGELFIANSSGPSTVTGGAAIYAASGEMAVKDASGNSTTISPHNFKGIPQGKSEEMAWSFYSEKDGKYINVDMLKLARLLEKLTGEKLVYMGDTKDLK